MTMANARTSGGLDHRSSKDDDGSMDSNSNVVGGDEDTLRLGGGKRRRAEDAEQPSRREWNAHTESPRSAKPVDAWQQKQQQYNRRTSNAHDNDGASSSASAMAEQAHLHPHNHHTGAAPPSSRGGSRASGEKRSRRGCQTCKMRRKKCPEDFAFRADGSYACSTCFQKGLSCGEHSSSSGGGGEGLSALLQHQHKSHVTAPSSSLAYTAGGSSYTSASTPSGSTLLASAPGSTLIGQEPARFTATQPLQQTSSAQTLQNIPSSNTNNAEILLDSSWLDDFFKEFSSLSDPIYQDAMWLANSSTTSAPSSRTTATAPTSVPSADITAFSSAASWSPTDNINPTSSSSSATTATTTSNSLEYDRIVQSDELDSLLERYSPLYEKLWRAAFSVSQPDNGLTRAILALSRASKSCRAATVASCLSYHHIMQRERAAITNPRNSMGLSHFLLSGSDMHNSAAAATSTTSIPNIQARAFPDGPEATAQAMQWPTAEERVSMAYKWYQFAMDEYKRSGRTGTLEQRLATLLNLRWTIITLDGSNAGLYYMEEIRSMITQMGVTTGYLRHTGRRGTVLTVLVQSALATDVFESATKRNQRCALRHSPASLTTPASATAGGAAANTPSSSSDGLSSEVLARDLQQGPLYEYEFTSCLTEQIIECIMLISNLDADRHEGLVTSQVEVTQRCAEIEEAIDLCRFHGKTNLHGSAIVRATALHEMWRQAVLIQYYQVIHRLGPLAAKVQQCLHQVLSLSSMMSAAMPTPSETWDMWMVWFLSATVAVTPEQRSKCLRCLEALGSEQAILDNIKVAKLVWKLTDDTGLTQDWRTVAERNGLGVCFAF